MSDSKLEVIKQHRDALLLGEVAALFHDMGKCSDDHLIHQASDCPTGHQYHYKTAWSHLLPASPQSVSLLAETVSIKDLSEKGMPRIISDTSQPWILRVLGRCHSVAHVEKELDENYKATKQPQNDTRQSNPFGIEGNPVSGLTSRLTKLSFAAISDRARFVLEAKEAFAEALGDTRRPVNEVTLADWSTTVASFYKSALAGALLVVQPKPDDLRWRLLRINFDVLGLYAKAVKIADLLSYHHVVRQAYESVKQLVEEEYPLGNEVYQDTTGIYFTFPDFDLPAELAQEILRRIEEIEPELAPRIAVGRGSGNTATEQLKGLLAEQRKLAVKEIAFPISRDNYSPCWEAKWKNLPSDKWEVCPVCRLRPKKEEKDACQHCCKRRQSRIGLWKKDPAKTIWLDEIADHNDRVALFIGKFGLDDWLSGDFVQTMLVRAKENDPTGCTPKNPSPARLRRVWETCQRFWTETVEKTILEPYEYAKDKPDAALRCARLFVTPNRTTGWQENIPYDGVINGQPVSLLWREKEQHFVTAINLQLAAGQTKTPQESQDKWLGCDVEVDDPDNFRKRISFKVEAVTSPTDPWAQYRPYLTLLTSPDQFLAFIPASDSLEIAERIRQEYQKLFGKVQNRLPLFLGLVFLQRKTPLLAAMDTARRMLEQVSFPEETWMVECSREKEAGCWCLRLGSGEQRLHFDVPVKMGDGTTEDVWYPYYFIPDGMDVTDRRYRFQHDGRWLVHITNLREGDQVSITPSRFAYFFLEQTSQRFHFDPARDVRLLDELPLLLDMWKRLQDSDLTDTGLRNVDALLETKATQWGHDSKELRHLAETTLTASGLWRQKDKSDVVTPEEVLSRRFRRCLELYLQILKARLKEK